MEQNKSNINLIKWISITLVSILGLLTIYLWISSISEKDFATSFYYLFSTIAQVIGALEALFITIMITILSITIQIPSPNNFTRYIIKDFIFRNNTFIKTALISFATIMISLFGILLSTLLVDKCLSFFPFVFAGLSISLACISIYYILYCFFSEGSLFTNLHELNKKYSEYKKSIPFNIALKVTVLSLFSRIEGNKFDCNNNYFKKYYEYISLKKINRIEATKKLFDEIFHYMILLNNKNEHFFKYYFIELSEQFEWESTYPGKLNSKEVTSIIIQHVKNIIDTIDIESDIANTGLIKLINMISIICFGSQDILTEENISCKNFENQAIFDYIIDWLDLICYIYVNNKNIKGITYQENPILFEVLRVLTTDSQDPHKNIIEIHKSLFKIYLTSLWKYLDCHIEKSDNNSDFKNNIKFTFNYFSFLKVSMNTYQLFNKEEFNVILRSIKVGDNYRKRIYNFKLLIELYFEFEISEKFLHEIKNKIRIFYIYWRTQKKFDENEDETIRLIDRLFIRNIFEVERKNILYKDLRSLYIGLYYLWELLEELNNIIDNDDDKLIIEIYIKKYDLNLEIINIGKKFRSYYLKDMNT